MHEGDGEALLQPGLAGGAGGSGSVAMAGHRRRVPFGADGAMDQAQQQHTTRWTGQDVRLTRASACCTAPVRGALTEVHATWEGDGLDFGR
jgi:hypothetical protein